MLVYPMDRAAYSRLCRLLSIGKGRAGKGGCRLGWDDVAAWGEGQIVVLVPGRIDGGLGGRLRRLKSDFGDRAYLALTRRFRPNDALRLYRLEETARAARVPTVATNASKAATSTWSQSGYETVGMRTSAWSLPTTRCVTRRC